MSLNSDQEMDKQRKEEAKQGGEKRTQFVRKEEQKPEEEEQEEQAQEKHTQYVRKKEQKKPEEEEEAQEKHTISDAPPSPTTHSSLRDHKPSSPHLDSSSPSSLSSDRSFHSNELIHPTVPPETSPLAVANRVFRADPVVVAHVNPEAQEGFTSVREVEAGTNNRGGSGRRLRQNLSILKGPRRENMVKRALLGLRISGFVFCLISFSVMAADKSQGWALDSFYNYKEFRYCMAVNVIGFAYSGLQVLYDLVHFTTGKDLDRHHHRHYFNFSMDQKCAFAFSCSVSLFYNCLLEESLPLPKARNILILTYLLLSASSSAATRVYDWKSNWGEDKFPDMASASLGLSFVAFLAFALSSLISGYTICKTP